MNDNDMNFLFYDLETGGLNKNFTQIYTFNAVKTDCDFNIVDSLDLKIRPTPDFFGSYGAYKTNGLFFTCDDMSLTPQNEAARTIYEFMLSPYTIHTGYNNLKFDREVLRQLFYRNLYDPYVPEYAEKASCWDLISLVRAAHDYRPNLLKWPVREDSGLPDLRLEAITKANGMNHENAHTAASDVLATIELAKYIKQKDPAIFAYALRLRNKRQAESMISDLKGRIVLLTDSSFYSSYGYTHPVMPVCQSPESVNQWYAIDLSNEYRLSELSKGNIGGNLVKISLNKAPFFRSADGVSEKALSMLGINSTDMLRCASEAKRILQSVEDTLWNTPAKEYPKNADVYAQMYDGFFTEEDRNMATMAKSCKSERYISNISSPALRTLTTRYLCNFCRESVSPEVLAAWDEECRNAIVFGRGDDDGLVRFMKDAEDDFNSQTEINADAEFAKRAITLASDFINAHGLQDLVLSELRGDHEK